MMETTNRGFPILRFLDADGASCSIQDSSMAERDCVWLGRDGPEEVRMHLTVPMAAEVLKTLDTVETVDVHFDDLYGSSCIVSPMKDGVDGLRVGVTVDFEGGVGRPMRLSRKEMTLLRPLLSTFVETGSIME